MNELHKGNACFQRPVSGLSLSRNQPIDDLIDHLISFVGSSMAMACLSFHPRQQDKTRQKNPNAKQALINQRGWMRDIMKHGTSAFSPSKISTHSLSLSLSLSLSHAHTHRERERVEQLGIMRCVRVFSLRNANDKNRTNWLHTHSEDQSVGHDWNAIMQSK